MFKILIAIPTAKHIEVETFKSIYDLDKRERDWQVDFQYFFGYRIDQVRNLICHYAIENSYTHVLFLDSDMILPRDTLVKMVDRNAPHVTAIYRQRKEEQILELYYDHESGYKNFTDKIDRTPTACGFGCSLVWVNYLKDLGYPWFDYKHALRIEDTISEDIYFCDKARKKYGEVPRVVDIFLGHVGSRNYEVKGVEKIEDRLRSLRAMDLIPHGFRRTMREAIGSEPIESILDVGACVLHWHDVAKNIWPSAKICCVDVLYEAQKTFKDEVEYHQALLSNKSGERLGVHVNPYHPGGNSIYKENPSLAIGTNDIFGDASLRFYQTKTLDEMFPERRFDLIKMDIQGSEYEVIQGAKKLLDTSNYLIVECQHQDYNIGAKKLNDVEELLKSMGWKRHVMFELHRTDVDGDYLFVKF